MVSEKIIKDEKKILIILKKIVDSNQAILLWQKLTDRVDNTTHFGVIRGFDNLDNSIEIAPSDSRSFEFIGEDTEGVYILHNKLSFYVALQRFDAHLLECAFPSEVVVEGDLDKGLFFFKKGDKDKFTHFRRSPRIPAEKGRYIGLVRNETPEKVEHYSLSDLSRGGLSLMVDDPGPFLAGQVFTIFNIDGRPPGKKFFCEIVYIKKMNGPYESFMVGAKFVASRDGGRKEEDGKNLPLYLPRPFQSIGLTRSIACEGMEMYTKMGSFKGGVNIVSKNSQDFHHGDFVTIHNIDGKPLKDSKLGIVDSVKRVDENEDCYEVKILYTKEDVSSKKSQGKNIARSTLRFRPKKETKVAIRKRGKVKSGKKNYHLYDLSKVGIAIITTRSHEFSKNEKVDIFQVGSRVFNEAIIGEIVHITHLKGQDCYKVGIEFTTVARN